MRRPENEGVLDRCAKHPEPHKSKRCALMSAAVAPMICAPRAALSVRVLIYLKAVRALASYFVP
jgi:hypothetical protein